MLFYYIILYYIILYSILEYCHILSYIIVLIKVAFLIRDILNFNQPDYEVLHSVKWLF